MASVMALTLVCDKAAALENMSPMCVRSVMPMPKAFITPTSVSVACSMFISPTVARFMATGRASSESRALRPACDSIRRPFANSPGPYMLVFDSSRAEAPIWATACAVSPPSALTKVS